MNLLPLAALLIFSRRRGTGPAWPTPASFPEVKKPMPTPEELTLQPGAVAPAAAPPGAVAPSSSAEAVRFGVVKSGEGPYQFTARVVGPQFAGQWKRLRESNPSIRLNRKGDNFTNASWRPGMRVQLPQDWPGGTAVSGDDAGTV